MDPSETGKGKQPKEQHEIADYAVDLRSLSLGSGLVHDGRRLLDGRQRVRRIGRIGEFRWEFGNQREPRHRRSGHYRRTTHFGWDAGNRRLCKRWGNAGHGRFCKRRGNTGHGRFF
jgi:hypothetical protein